MSYTYDGAGRLNSFTGNLGDGTARTYADTFVYDGAGRISQERYGTQTPVYNKHFFNSRGQLAEIRVSTYGLTAPGQETNWNREALINHYSDSGWGASGGGPDNNGDLKKQDVYIPNDDAISGYSLTTSFYDYDALNRLRQVLEVRGGSNQWLQQYDYDRWGNRTINAAATQVYGQNPGYTIPEPQFTVDTATNRLGVPAGQSGQMAYDAAGNLVTDTYQGGQGGGGARTYDAENRMTAAGFFAGQAQTASYVYDGDGRRVKRMAGTSAEVWQVYGAGGELLAEYAPGAAPTSPQKEYGYRGGELLVTAAPGAATAPAPRTNVAAASAGATATASTAYDAYGLTTARAINGSRTYAGVYWNDQTAGTFPDWLQVNFAGAKTVGEVDLYFLQDNYGTAEPSESTTFTQYGITSFDVQYWTGAAWAAVPSGSVTGNDKVWRKLTFPAVTTDKIRVVVNAATDGWSRIVEVEAYEGGAGATGADVRWLVTDHLGTPRMVLDQTGSLAGVTRHDYLPFGEELFANTGGRTPAQGYSAIDNLREKFTGKERDIETGLDYLGARYYGSNQGRFISPDPLLSSAVSKNPQTWNRYTYALDTPTRLVDPLGLFVFDKNVDAATRDKIRVAFIQAWVNLIKIAATYGYNSKEYTSAKRALTAYGVKGQKNGVTIFVQKNTGYAGGAQVEGIAHTKTQQNPNGQNIHVTFDENTIGNQALSDVITHEGTHVADGSDWVSSGFKLSANPLAYKTEFDAYTVESIFAEARDPHHSTSAFLPYYKPPGKNPYLAGNVEIYNPGWAGADRATLSAFKASIDRILARPKQGGGYGLTPTSTTRAFQKGSHF